MNCSRNTTFCGIKYHDISIFLSFSQCPPPSLQTMLRYQLVKCRMQVTIMIQRVMGPDCCIINLSAPRVLSDRKTKAHTHRTDTDTHTQKHNPFKPIPLSASYLSINQSTNPKEETKTERERDRNESKGGREPEQCGGLGFTIEQKKG